MKQMKQREMMRLLLAQIGPEREKVCAAYAVAEREGRVMRGRNARQSTPERYATALWNDGQRKGWLLKP